MHSRDEPLPHRPKRVLVAGVSGSGKTTLAGRIAGITGGPHMEIDAIFQLRREELWNGNLEAPLRTFFTDRDHIVRWAIRTRRKYTELMPHFVNDYPHVCVVRLRGQAEVEEWLRRSLIPAITG
ncbi:ATP-binding protein [Arthrobacter sp. B6]|uniref:ATP-binding protein n=1 Tax=Arthrobacter sp. B6 TaxID=1570137 RepID=UPI00082F35F5|nr:hypothetical protein [Arthrobacter sp. B6]